MEPTTVYQYFAANGALIYVGITNRGIRRLHEHADSKPWWPMATGCTLEHFETRDAALVREKYLIQTFRPPYNDQHNPERLTPVDERARQRLRREAIRIAQSDDRIKARRREWHKLSHLERLVEPCVRCGQRPGITGPECLNCRQLQAAIEKPGFRASDHRKLHRNLHRGDVCPQCHEVMTHRPPAQRDAG